MEESKQITDDLATEKLRLEIVELRDKVSNSKKSKTWEDYVKPIIPVAVTLVIAISVSIITRQFNRSQLEITKSKNQSDKEIAQINASLSYIKLMNDISDSSFQLRQQAKTVIAPILPPETSFNIAVSELPNNPNVLKVLIKKYGDESWRFLAPYLEFLSIDNKMVAFVSNGNLHFKTFKDIDYNSYNLEIGNSLADSMFRVVSHSQTLLKGENIRNKYFILNFLENNQLLTHFSKYLISENYQSSSRVLALIHYLDYTYHNPSVHGNLARQQKIFEEYSTLIDNTKDTSLKIDLSLSTSFVLMEEDRSEGWKFIEIAASHFWDDLDVSKGETPVDGSVKKILYDGCFQGEYYKFSTARRGIDIVKKKLFENLSLLDYSNMDDHKIWLILHAYSERNYRDTTSTAYLHPSQTCQLIDKILVSRKACEQKRDMAFFLGSASTIMLHESMSQDSIAARQFVKSLINWYVNNYSSLKSCDKEYGEMVLGELKRTLQLVSKNYQDLNRNLK